MDKSKPYIYIYVDSLTSKQSEPSYSYIATIDHIHNPSVACVVDGAKQQFEATNRT